ncbi:MAG TPA: M48 family metalloprotease [Burkholderiales bacterium]|nr:M48 family metalloprotease [Burkholderiales bacterium]
MRIFIVLLLAFTACACATRKSDVKALWLPASQDAWSNVPPEGLKLKRKDGSAVLVPEEVIHNVVTVKHALEQTSRVHADLALVEMDSPNALAFEYQGRPVIALSLTWLDRLGMDVDALATTVGHELAHVELGHTSAARQKRDDAATGTSQVLGTVLNLAGVPMGGTIASLGVAAYARSFTRDEERAADDLGLRWAVETGYDPCGRFRTMQMYRSLQASGIDLPFLSTHPGAAERSDLANDYSLKLDARACK